MAPIAAWVCRCHVALQVAALIFPAEIAERQGHGAELAVLDFVQYHHALPVPLPLPPAIGFLMQIAAPRLNPPQGPAQGRHLRAHVQSLNVAVNERAVDLVELVENGAADGPPRMAGAKIVCVIHAIDVHHFQKFVPLPAPRVALVAANMAEVFGVANGCAVCPVFMVAHQKDFARSPAPLLFQRPADAFHRVIARSKIGLVPLAFHVGGARFFVTVQGGEVPCIAKIDNHIRPVFHDGLADPAAMVQRNARPGLNVRHDEMALGHTRL
jgi:hypothetical protein